MELWYYLLGVYSPNQNQINKATELFEKLNDTNYIEDDDVSQLAKQTNSVFLVEVEQEDGYAEFIVCDNHGRIRKRAIFSFDEVDKAKSEIAIVGTDNYFSKTALKVIDEHSAEYELSRDEFIDEYLSEYFMELYDNKKQDAIQNIRKFFEE